MITASIVGPTFVTVMLNGQTMTIDGSNPNYAAIREALKAKDHQLVESLINTKKAVESFAAGQVEVRGDQVFYGSLEIKGSVVQRILQMVREGFDSQPMLNFLANLMANPSKRAVDELYGFLEATGLPITEDGRFLAYKKVNDNYRDFYTGTMDNSIGTVVEMPRNQVDDERDRTCSYGLHFCSLEYLPMYHGGAGRVLIVKINPSDVVSIPSDYNNAKGRACRYEVIGEYEGNDRESKDYFTAPVYSNTNPVAPGQRIAAGTTSVLEDDADCDYDLGYDAGSTRAQHDTSSNRSYNTTPPKGHSEEFEDGFVDGYSEHYEVDWEDLGAALAENHVVDSRPYDDTPPAGCVESDEQYDFRTGYANGWSSAKISRLSY